MSYNAGAATDDGAGQRPCKGRIFRVGASDTVRTFGEGLGRSTVAHFARKVRGTNIVAALRGLKIQQSYAPERWSCSLRVRGPHFASKVSYNAGAAPLAASALKGQSVLSPGQRPGYQCINPYAL